MSPSESPVAITDLAAGCPAGDPDIPELVAQLYEAAPAVERAHLLEPLLRPLGVLSLLGVAGGIFARAKLHGGWQNLQVRLEEIRAVRGVDVAALVVHAQRVCAEAVDGLAQFLAASPALSGSAAAALVVTLLLKRQHGREATPAPARSSAADAG